MKEGHLRRDRVDYCDPDEDIMKKVRVEALVFDGQLDPKVFLDLFAELDSLSGMTHLKTKGYSSKK